MTRADLEAAAEEKYPETEWSTPATLAAFRAAYIQGRLDQAEADKRIAEESSGGYDQSDWRDVDEAARGRIAAEIQKGVQ